MCMLFPQWTNIDQPLVFCIWPDWLPSLCNHTGHTPVRSLSLSPSLPLFSLSLLHRSHPVRSLSVHLARRRNLYGMTLSTTSKETNASTPFSVSSVECPWRRWSFVSIPSSIKLTSHRNSKSTRTWGNSDGFVTPSSLPHHFPFPTIFPWL